MKKLMKKLAAIALAGAMALSCCAMALATDPATQLTNGESSGTGRRESNRLAHPIRVVLPTKSETIFNMILDPHELIKSTSAARYSDATFNYATKMFFQTSENNYSGNSATLLVENKGDCDVSLGVELVVDKADSEFVFVNTPGELEPTPDLDADAGDQPPAQMYLALVSGDTVKALGLPGPEKVVNVAVENATDGKAVVNTTGAAFAFADGLAAEKKAAFATALGDGKSLTVTSTYVDDPSESYTFSLSSALTISGYTVTMDPDTTDWATELEADGEGAVAAMIKKGAEDIGTLSFKLADVSSNGATATGTVTMTVGEGEAPVPTVTDAAAKVAKTGDTLISSATFTFDAGATAELKNAFATAMTGKSFVFNWDETAVSPTAPSVTGYTITQTPSSVVAATRQVSYAIVTDDTDETSVGTLVVNLTDEIEDYDEDTEASAAVTIDFKKDDGKSVTFKTSLPKTAGAYEDTWVESKSAYERTPVDSVTEFEKVAFYLTGDINNTVNWDDQGDDITITVTWDLKEYDETYNEEGGSEGPSADGGTPAASNKKPTVSVTRAATAAGGSSVSGRDVTLSYTAGTGTYEDYAPTSMTYVKDTNEAGTITVTWAADKTGTFAVSSAISRGSNYKIIFTSAADDTKTVEVELAKSDFYQPA